MFHGKKGADERQEAMIAANCRIASPRSPPVTGSRPPVGSAAVRPSCRRRRHRFWRHRQLFTYHCTSGPCRDNSNAGVASEPETDAHGSRPPSAVRRHVVDVHLFLIDRASREAIAIDSVDTQVERDLAVVRRLDLRLHYVLETHAHADHITGAGKLRE